MYWCAIETSARLGSIALSRESELVDSFTFDTLGQHSQNLIPAVQQLLQKHGAAFSQVSTWCVGLGPGSYTGIRVAIAAVQGFQVSFPSRIFGVSSVESMANAAVKLGIVPASPFVIALDARRGDAYWQEFEIRQGKAHPTGSLTIYSPATAAAYSGLVLGSDPLFLQKWKSQNSMNFRLLETPIFPDARQVLELAYQKSVNNPSGDGQLDPIYLREMEFKKAPASPFVAQ